MARKHRKRLVKSPKIYIRDSGLVHCLLSIESIENLLGHPVVGSSWEGFCIENILRVAPSTTEGTFYRTSGGAEIDLVLEMPDGAVWAIEIKRATNPSVSRGFHVAADDIGADHRYVVYAGTREVPASNGVRAIPLEAIMSKLVKD